MLFSSAFFWRCANIGSPQGGPKDTLPPNVMGATPAFNTTNFTGTRIYVAFDEYVQLKDQQKEFFSSPKMKRYGGGVWGQPGNGNFCHRIKYESFCHAFS